MLRRIRHDGSTYHSPFAFKQMSSQVSLLEWTYQLAQETSPYICLRSISGLEVLIAFVASAHIVLLPLSIYQALGYNTLATTLLLVPGGLS